MQKLVDPTVNVGQDVGHGDTTMHGLGRPIGVCAHQPFQRLFGEVRASEAVAGRKKVEDVGQRELALLNPQPYPPMA